MEEPLCFKAIRTRRNRSTSISSCIADNATFPILRSKEAQEKLLKFTSSAGDVLPFWLGLTFNDTINKIKWDTDEEFMPTEYDKFYSSHHPNSSRPCSLFYIDSGEWRNEYCHNDWHAVCMTWSSNIKPLYVSSETDPDIDGVYDPENGVFLNGASVYKQQSLYGTPYLLRNSEISTSVRK